MGNKLRAREHAAAEPGVGTHEYKNTNTGHESRSYELK